MTRAGQVGAVALASLAGVVLAVGLPGTGVPKIERAEPIEPTRAIDTGPVQEPPALLEKRAGSISRNLAQLGNSPKIAPPTPDPTDDAGDGGTTPVAPGPAVAETAITFLGLLGSPARPMALVSIDSHQQVLAVGDIIHKGTGEKIKLVKVEKSGIEIEMKGAIKKVEVAPRTGATYTTLQNAPSPVPNPGLVPGVPPPPPGGNVGRPRRDNGEMRAPGGRRPGGSQRFDEAGGVRE